MRALLLAMTACVFSAMASDPEPLPPPKAEAVKKWGAAEVVVVARLDSAESRGAGLSDPPVYLTALTLTVAEPLRGGVKKGEKVNASHSIRQRDEPRFPVGKDCLVSLTRARGSWVVTAIEESRPAALAEVRSALALPPGWVVDGKAIKSPWASLGKPDKAIDWKFKGLTCSVTGRPAFLAGPAAEVQVEHVKPKVEKKFQNPDGDGEYTITVKNPTDKAITVPALLRSPKGDILWRESIVIVCQGKSYPAPGAKGLREAAEPVTLKPGESVSGVVNALGLKGPEWPRGGYRIELTFALGDRAVTKSFYYFSKHHDPIRDKAASE
jgi:hypothetical protein